MIIINANFIQRITIDWNKIAEESYTRTIASLSGLTQLDFNHPVTFFAGENGSGKSTLLEAIAIKYGFNPEGGSRNYQFSTYDTHSELFNGMRVSRGAIRADWGYFLRAESFYNVATKELEYSDKKHPAENYHEKSHGESFLALAQKQFKPNGLYILDEPEAALSQQRQLALLSEIRQCVNAGSQFIIVSHSPILLGYPGAEILVFDDGEVHNCAYEETESYQITEMFINNKEQVLRNLFD
ncbi:MAG: AAA family ATPase [Liquorilactobacillus sp.]